MNAVLETSGRMDGWMDGIETRSARRLRVRRKGIYVCRKEGYQAGDGGEGRNREGRRDASCQLGRAAAAGRGHRNSPISLGLPTSTFITNLNPNPNPAQTQPTNERTNRRTDGRKERLHRKLTCPPTQISKLEIFCKYRSEV